MVSSLKARTFHQAFFSSPPHTSNLILVDVTVVMGPQGLHVSPVYDAVVVPDNNSDQLKPWWKRHQGLLFIGVSVVLGALVAIAVPLMTNKDNDGPVTNVNSYHDAPQHQHQIPLQTLLQTHM